MSDAVVASPAWSWSESTRTTIVLGVGFVGIVHRYWTVQGPEKVITKYDLEWSGSSKPIQKRSRTEANYERFTVWVA